MTWLLSREEREQHVIQLYKENKSVREIAKLSQVSYAEPLFPNFVYYFRSIKLCIGKILRIRESF